MVTDNITVCVRLPEHEAFLRDVPEYVRVVDVSRWSAVPADIREINPAAYPAVINGDTGQVIERPQSWAAAIAKLAATPAVPDQVTPRQFRLALLARGITPDHVTEALSGIEDDRLRAATMIEWEYGLYVPRNHPLLDQLAPLFSLTAEQVDDLFVDAAIL